MINIPRRLRAQRIHQPVKASSNYIHKSSFACHFSTHVRLSKKHEGTLGEEKATDISDATDKCRYHRYCDTRTATMVALQHRQISFIIEWRSPCSDTTAKTWTGWEPVVLIRWYQEVQIRTGGWTFALEQPSGNSVCSGRCELADTDLRFLHYHMSIWTQSQDRPDGVLEGFYKSSSAATEGLPWQNIRMLVSDKHPEHSKTSRTSKTHRPTAPLETEASTSQSALGLVSPAKH